MRLFSHNRLAWNTQNGKQAIRLRGHNLQPHVGDREHSSNIAVSSTLQGENGQCIQMWPPKIVCYKICYQDFFGINVVSRIDFSFVFRCRTTRLFCMVLDTGMTRSTLPRKHKKEKKQAPYSRYVFKLLLQLIGKW